MGRDNVGELGDRQPSCRTPDRQKHCTGGGPATVTPGKAPGLTVHKGRTDWLLSTTTRWPEGRCCCCCCSCTACGAGSEEEHGEAHESWGHRCALREKCPLSRCGQGAWGHCRSVAPETSIPSSPTSPQLTYSTFSPGITTLPPTSSNTCIIKLRCVPPGL